MWDKAKGRRVWPMTDFDIFAVRKWRQLNHYSELPNSMFSIELYDRILHSCISHTFKYHMRPIPIESENYIWTNSVLGLSTKGKYIYMGATAAVTTTNKKKPIRKLRIKISDYLCVCMCVCTFVQSVLIFPSGLLLLTLLARPERDQSATIYRVIILFCVTDSLIDLLKSKVYIQCIQTTYWQLL